MINTSLIKNFCNEDISHIENYEKAMTDDTSLWVCHHRLELNDGYRLSAAELKGLELYYKRPANELIFLTRNEHARIHNSGIIRPEEYKKNMSSIIHQIHKEHPEIRKGVSDKLKGHLVSNETKQKISNKNKGHRHTKESIEKIGQSSKGKHFYTNGMINVFRYTCPKGFYPGMLINRGKKK